MSRSKLLLSIKIERDELQRREKTEEGGSHDEQAISQKIGTVQSVV